jgi:S-DNA-T family DNA segregation ATPase FtsK/SpoIIIE
MDSRHKLLQEAEVGSLKEYNALHPDECLPYVVVVIDEFGNLILTAGREAERLIVRIAQSAHAVGIHLVIATQRPAANIITEAIKANFPARAAFRVISSKDSAVILDRTGANQLLGKGDMLFLQGNEPVRVQCAFVYIGEVRKITEYIDSNMPDGESEDVAGRKE